VEVDELPGELNLLDLDQCVVSNEAEDEVSKELDSVAADTSSGELVRMVLDPVCGGAVRWKFRKIAILNSCVPQI
jgi:hypothetical protein